MPSPFCNEGRRGACLLYRQDMQIIGLYTRQNHTATSPLCLSVSLCVSVCLSVCVSLPPPLSVSVSVRVPLAVSFSLCPSLSVCPHLSLGILFSVCLSVCLPPPLSLPLSRCQRSLFFLSIERTEIQVCNEEISRKMKCESISYK